MALKACTFTEKEFHTLMSGNYLVGADEVEMENSQASNKPNSYEAIYNQENREDIPCHSLQNTPSLMHNANPRKYMDV